MEKSLKSFDKLSYNSNGTNYYNLQQHLQENLNLMQISELDKPDELTKLSTDKATPKKVASAKSIFDDGPPLNFKKRQLVDSKQ